MHVRDRQNTAIWHPEMPDDHADPTSFLYHSAAANITHTRNATRPLRMPASVPAEKAQKRPGKAAASRRQIEKPAADVTSRSGNSSPEVTYLGK
ncbi:hypothetical protein M8818_005047 [Zalaria obscura]|uniref:Uncharacterized protein n=1 Tax=Zalaria obscura TaxID=2024903 RepID=A0ACC3SAL0_9PEZI